MTTFLNQNHANLLSPAIEVILPRFGQAMTAGTTEIERKILAQIQANSAGLQLFRADGLYRNRELCTNERRAVYKLHSPAQGTEIVFSLGKWDGEPCAIVLMLFTAPARQGNFFTLKDFILKRVCLVLFGAGFKAITGDAQPTRSPVRHKRDFRREYTKAGIPKLVRLYQLLGFTRTIGNNVAMTREDFDCLAA